MCGITNLGLGSYGCNATPKGSLHSVTIFNPDGTMELTVNFLEEHREEQLAKLLDKKEEEKGDEE